MVALIVWTIGLLASVPVLVILASMNSYVAHLVFALAVVAVVALAAYRKNRLELARRILSPSGLASINATYMTLIWAWGGISIAAIYLLSPELHELNWWRKEWWQFVLGFGAAAVTSAIFAYMLYGDQSEYGDETRLTRWSRYFAIIQLIAMVGTMLGLIIDGKMDFGWIDWSANNIFFSGAAGLAVVSWIALRTQKQLKNR